MLPDGLKEKLDSFSGKSEHEVSEIINNHLKEEEIVISDSDTDLMAEAMAFDFHENYPTDKSPWGTYYGPMWVMPNEEGIMMESPSIQRVTKEMLDYWSLRSTETGHPLMRARYADLVWDFKTRVTNTSPDITLAHTVIDSNIAIAQQNLHKYEVQTITKLSRALSLALSINDEDRVKAVRDAIVDYEDRIAVDNKPGLWGFSFDLLMENKKVPLTDEQKNKIIKDLESRLARISDTSNSAVFDPHGSEYAALRLARYYNKTSDKDNVARVLKLYGGAFLKASEAAAAMVGVAWLKKVYGTYLNFGMKADADALNAIIHELSKKSAGEMKTISHEFSISKQEMDDYLNTMTAGELEAVFNRIAIRFLQSKEELIEQIHNTAKEAVLQALFSITIVDHEGRPIAKVGSIEEDLDGRVVHQLAQNIGFSSVFLRHVIEKLKADRGLNAGDVIERLYKSPIFSLKKKEIIEIGLKAYFDNDYLIAIHLLIPQIEDVLRNLVKMTGGPIYKVGRHGGLMLKNFEELLRDERVTEVLSSDVTLYFRTLFSDQRGLNVRNNVCHGLSPIETFGPAIADRIFHALLVLALVKEKKE